MDFGHVHLQRRVGLHVGYLGCSILLKASDELMTLVINSLRNDLKPREDNLQCLSLCSVGNLDLSETMSPDVAELLTSSASILMFAKKTCRLLPDNPTPLPVEDLENRLNDLMGESHVGVVTSAASLLQTALLLHPTAFRSLLSPVSRDSTTSSRTRTVRVTTCTKTNLASELIDMTE